jgi:uncharacterized protein
MLEEPVKKTKGFLEGKPLPVFVWAILPIVFIFGFTLANESRSDSSFLEESGFYALILAQTFFVLVMLLFPALLLSSFYKKDFWNFLNLQKMPKKEDLALAFGMIFSANFFINFLVNLNKIIPLSPFWEQKFTNLHEQASATQAFFLNYNGLDQLILVFLVMAIIPAIVEEIYFRGLLVGLLKDLKISVFHVIFVSSLLFAMMHFQFYHFLALLFMGALLGYIYYRTQNLWLSIFVHLLNNGLIVIFTASNKAKITSLDLEQDPPLYLSIIGLLLFAALSYYFHQRTQALAEEEL